MDLNINISFEMIQEFDKILWMIAELGAALEQTDKSLNLLGAGSLAESATNTSIPLTIRLMISQTDDLYEGKAKEDMILFYKCCRNHIQTLINLYGKAYQYAVNAIVDMLEQDRKIARILQEDLPW